MAQFLGSRNKRGGVCEGTRGHASAALRDDLLQHFDMLGYPASRVAGSPEHVGSSRLTRVMTADEESTLVHTTEFPTNPVGDVGGTDTPIGEPGLGRRRGVATEEVRRHNLGAVLERIHFSGSLSRSELTAMTGLNRSTVADLLGELTSLGLVEERPGLSASGPGRPSPLVQSRPEGATVLAVDLAVDSIAVGRRLGLGGRRRTSQVRVDRRRPGGGSRRTRRCSDVVEAGAERSSPTQRPPKRRAGRRRRGGRRRRPSQVRRVRLDLAPEPRLARRPASGRVLARRARPGRPRSSAANEADLGALAEHRRGARGPGIGRRAATWPAKFGVGGGRDRGRSGR